MLAILKNRICVSIFIFLFSCAFSSGGESEILFENNLAVTENKPATEVSQILLHPVSVLSGKVNIFLPKDFELMDPETIAVKYPMEGRRPTEVYTNGQATVNIAFNHTSTTATMEALPEIQKAFSAQFSHPNMDIISNSIQDIHGRKFILLEMVTPAVDTRIYNLMFATALEGRLLIGTFNCIEELRKEWEATAKEIVHSVKIE